MGLKNNECQSQAAVKSLKKKILKGHLETTEFARYSEVKTQVSVMAFLYFTYINHRIADTSGL